MLVAPSAPQIPPKGFVYRLRKKGLKLRVKHYRYVQAGDMMLGASSSLELVTRQNKSHFMYIDSRGGKTEVEVTLPNGKSAVGVSTCSAEDNYCRRLGTYLAFQRAIKKIRNENTV